MIEYEVIILDPSPDEAAQTLNELAAMGWKVTGTYAEDRIIIEREKPVLKAKRGILRAINEPEVA